MAQKLRVQLRNGFSDRMQIKPINRQFQIKDLDERTRVAIINKCHLAFSLFEQTAPRASVLLRYDILKDVYGQEVNDFSTVDDRTIRMIITTTIREDDYDDVLTVIEYLVKKMDGNIKPRFYAKAFNEVFEQEYVGYRFVDTNIVPITATEETAAIEEALSSPYDEVSAHLAKATGFIADRKKPDYENAVKESISAVERMCFLIGGKCSGLKEAFKKLEDKGMSVHPSMKEAFIKLYGYTSDASGIRHAGEIGGKRTTFEEAKFMLVSCSAFVNYLKGVQEKTQ